MYRDRSGVNEPLDVTNHNLDNSVAQFAFDDKLV